LAQVEFKVKKTSIKYKNSIVDEQKIEKHVVMPFSDFLVNDD